MVKKDTHHGFDPSRFKFDSREEVQFGAYARRQRQRHMLVGALGVALIAVAIGMYVQLRPQSNAENPERYPVVLRCEACGETRPTTVPFGQTFPVKCEICGEIACRPLWRCRDCDARFAPDQTGTTVRCPECGSLAVGSAAGP